MKKGQLEAIGLVIIVLMIIFAALLFLFFSTRTSPDPYTSTLLQTKANNLRNTLLKTTLCPGSGIKEETISCIQYGSPICLQDCSELATRILNIVDGLLDQKEGYQYSFTYGINQTFLNNSRFNYPNCMTASNANLKDDIYFNIKLCRE